MPRMSKKRRLEWSFFLNHRNRITYNDLCRGCTHGCKQSFRAIIVLCPRYFKQKGVTKLPTYKALQAEIEQLTAEKNALYNEYRANKARVRELQTMKSNLSQMQHGEPSRQKRHEQER